MSQNNQNSEGSWITSDADAICITGISGSFPNSNSVQHLGENLFNKLDLITDDERRWKKTHPEIPQRTGKINNIEKFDATFFGVNYKEAHVLDPITRVLLEKVYECIIDAGLNPTQLRGTKTGVIVAICQTDSDKYWCYEKLELNEYGILGCSRSSSASRISQWLGVKGPCYAIDTACSSSMFAMEHAYTIMKHRSCDSVIVCGCNILLHPIISLQFARLGVLSPDGSCKSFDNTGNGYVRSEAIVACLLQKAKDSRRVYAQLVHAKSNCDGYKDKGITYPAGEMQKRLLKGFYEECHVDPTTIEYFEAHGTGTKVGDPEELNAIDEVVCTGRSEPLLIGSVKSNLGHSEASSALCSIAKLCVAYTTGYLPPNIKYSSPKKGIPALQEGRLQVVVEKTPWNRGLAGVSSFGFGGANAHVLLKNICKEKINNGLPDDDLPRLICISGRTNSAVNKILDDLQTRTVDVEEIGLWHKIHQRGIPRHDFRGYTVLRSAQNKTLCLSRDVQRVSNKERPIWFIYSGFGSNWPALARHFMVIPPFAMSIQKCHKVLEPKGFKLIDFISKYASLNLPDERWVIVGNVALHIAFTELFTLIGLKPDRLVGEGIVELSCAYADGCMTLEQTILAAHNITVGPEETVCVDRKNNDNILNVNLSHKQKPALCKYSSKLVNSNSIIARIGVQEITHTTTFNRNQCIEVSVANETEDELSFFKALGTLYEAGVNLELAQLYPCVQFPVAQGTPMLAHLVEWDHSEDWCVASYNSLTRLQTWENTIKISIDDEDNEYLVGHNIDGRTIFPATGYLIIVWEMLAQSTGREYSQVSVVFENVNILRATNLPKTGAVEFVTVIHKETGKFEITEKNIPVVNGIIREKKNVSKSFWEIPLESLDNTTHDSIKQIMLRKDFYKELKLRGYQYSGCFAGVLGCNIEGTQGRLLWDNNWVSFLDTMLQVNIIAYDTRSLYVPTRIEKLSIDVDLHDNILSKHHINRTTKSLDFRSYPYIQVTRCGGAELRNIHVTAISKKRPLGIPVYEKNEFIPNYNNIKMTVDDSLRSNIQLILENIQTYKFKTIEFVDEDYDTNGNDLIIERISNILADIPLIQADLQVFSVKPLEVPPTVTICNTNLTGQTNVVLFVGANLLKRQKVLEEGQSTLKKDCFVLSRETALYDIEKFSNVYDIVTVHQTEKENFVLFREKHNGKPTIYIELENELKYSWINKVKEAMNGVTKIVLYNQNEDYNGLLGLVNCLRKEPGGETVHGFLIADKTVPPFDPNLSFYRQQLNKELAVNVLKNGQWGTYRHLLLGGVDLVPVTHAYVNTAMIGDLSSLAWWEGSIKENQAFKNPDSCLVHVYCSALNFRDVMIATGRVTLDAVARGRLAQDCVQGFEITGRSISGSRIMSICQKGFSNLVEVDEALVWPFPDEWTFEEAATVPVAYATVYLCLVMVGKIRRGEKILIHAGSGAVGQAAINIALHYGLEVFTTVGTTAKREFLKKLYPQVKDSHIGNSRDTSFEDMIRCETNGQGVDIVLNSLADDKLQTSVKCLCRRGRFIEIGKYDITMNTQLEMCFMKKEVSFHGVMVDCVFDKESNKIKSDLKELMMSGIASGAVRPLTYCTFAKDEVEAAYRYMAAGKHVGKVIIKIRDEPQSNDCNKPVHTTITAIPRYTCDGQEVFVIIGGLGGFGLELIDWLVLRGARRFVVSSRRGVSNGYQAYRLRTWTKYQTDVHISTHDVTTESGCEKLLNMATVLGPVTAIFNLAVILNDAVFTNQTPETFENSFGPKAATTIHLDKLSRKLCPKLRNFVVFSSVSCGRGNAGQTNYGFSNSVMERICEKRKEQGLPALAIQWGAIGDVGLVADMQEENIQIEIGGTLQQRISSCLQAMDKFLKQDAAIVSSIVVAEKKVSNVGTLSVVDIVAQIMGISDLKTVSQQVPLSELGMDSIMAVEIKQTLERELEIFLTAQEIRSVTFAKLAKLHIDDGNNADNAATLSNDNTAFVKLILGNFGDEDRVSIPFIDFPSKNMEGVSGRTLFMLPGIESCAATLEPLGKKMNISTCIMQLGLNNINQSLEQMTQKLYEIVQPRLAPGGPFYLLGYSYGTLLVIKLAAKLESEGHNGYVICLDGSPEYSHSLVSKIVTEDDINDYAIQNSMMYITFEYLLPNKAIKDKLRLKLNPSQSYEERIKLALGMCPADLKYSRQFITSMCLATFNRVKENLIYQNSNKEKIKAPIILIRQKDIPSSIACDEFYGLTKLTEGTVTVHCIDADHVSIVGHDDTANIINETIANANKVLIKNIGS